MLALIRPDSWNLALFLHVLGAILVFGTTATLAIAGFASRRNATHNALLARTIAWTFLVGVLPTWLLMRIGAEWIASKEPWGHNNVPTPTWFDIGFILADALGMSTGAFTRWWSIDGSGFADRQRQGDCH